MDNLAKDYSGIFVEDVICNAEIYNDYMFCNGDELHAKQVVNKDMKLFSDVSEKPFGGLKDFMRAPVKTQAIKIPVMRPLHRVQAVLLPWPLVLLRKFCYVLAQKGDPSL